MWYFAWILGVLLACAFGIINVLWLEAQEGLDQHTAVLDPLTKLPNRFEFLQQLEQTLAKRETTPHPFSLLLISMDAFQAVCEQRGEAGVDKMILTVCNIIEQETRRQVDIVARYDAKTFAVVLTGTHAPLAEAIAGRIRDAAAAQLQEVGPESWISIGIAGYSGAKNNNRLTMDDLLRTADHALKQARQNGANQICRA